MVECLLGIDAGTTATKGILIRSGGGVLAEASMPASLFSPRPGWAEADPEQWWANVGTICRRLTTEGSIAPGDIAAIGVSGMVPAIVLVDSKGDVLRPSVQQNDARSHKEIEEFKACTDETSILARTGSPITQQSVGPKLLWFRNNEPELMKRVRWVMGSYDFINYRLTGVPSIEHNWALESGMYDLERHDWDNALLRLAQIERQQLGQVHSSSEVIGEVGRDAARLTGLQEGTPVVAGTADHVSSAFSACLTEEGDLLIKLGGAGDILYVLDQARPDPRLFIDYHVIPDKYLLNGCMASSGSIIKWFRSEFARELDYPELDDEASELRPGAEGLILLPYFIGEKTPIFDPLARGVLFGLSLHHTRAHIYRAILEGISYAFYHHVQVLRGEGYSIRKIAVTNGGSRSELWRQITADVLGQQLRQISRHPGSSLGAAFVAGMGVEAFQEWSEIEDYVEIGESTQPKMENHARYRELYAIYRELYKVTKPLFSRLFVST